jgi:TP901 family phage tail tape measure protein
VAGNQADIGIRVFLDDAASAGLYAINTQLGQMGTMAMRASNGFHNMSGEAMATMGILLGAGASLALFGNAIKFSIDSASQLQQSMFALALATHTTQDEAMRYEDVLMNLAAGSSYTSAEIANGMVQMGRAGYTLQDIMGSTADGLHGMATAGIALGIATRSDAVEGFSLLTQAMRAYQAPASEAMRYADLLQYAFEYQRGSVADFTAALSQVLPQASYFHVSLEEVISALDTFGPSMASSARAGTALRYMLSGLYSPTASAQAAMVNLKLATVDAGGHFHSVFFDAKGEPIEFAKAVQILHDHLAKLTPEQQIQAMHDLFSIKGGQGASDMIQMIDQFKKHLDDLSKSNDNAGGAMKRWADMMNTLSGASAGLRSSLTDLGASIGNAIIPAVTNAANFLNRIITAIRGVAQASPQAAVQFLTIGTAMSGLGLVAGIVLMVISGVGTGLLLIAGIAAGVVVAVVGLTVGIMLLVNWFRQFIASGNPFAVLMRQIGAAIAAAFAPTGFFGAALRALGGTISSMAAALLPAFRDAWTQVTIAFTALRPYLPMLGQLLLVLAGVIGGVILAAIVLLVAGLSGLARAFAVIIPAVVMVVVGLVTIFAGLVVFFQGVWNVIAGIFTLNGARIQAGFRQMGAGLLAIVFGALTAIIGVFRAVLGGIIAFVIGFVQAIISFFQHLAGTLVGHSIIPDMMNAIRNVIINGLNAVISFIATGVARIIAFFVQLGAQAVAAVQAAWNFIRNAFMAGVAAIAAVVASGVANVINWFSNMRSQLISTVNNAWSLARSAFSIGVSAVVSLAQGLPGRIVGAISSLGSMLYNAGSNAMSMMASGIAAGIGWVVTQATNAVNRIKSVLGFSSPPPQGPMADSDKYMPNMMRMFASGIESNIPMIQNASTRAAAGIASAPSTARLATPAPPLVGGGALGGNTTIPLMVDGQVLASVVLNRLTGQMQMNGVGRAFR